MGRSPCCDDVGVKKGPWTPEEDQKLVDHIQKHGHGSWRHLPKSAGLNRCGKSCRLRWTNYLRPDIKRGKFSEEEERLIIHLHSVLGNKWSSIAAKLQGRTDNEIKNHWNTNLRKKLLLMGIDPVTHRRRTNLELLAGLPNLLSTTNIGNLASTWDQALQLQADATQFARMQILQGLLQLLASPEYNNNSPPSLDLSGLLGASFASLHSFNVFHGHPDHGSTQTNLSAFGASQTPSSDILASFNQLPSLLFEEQEIASNIVDNISSKQELFDCNRNAAATNSIPSLVPSSPEHTSADVVMTQVSSNATSAAACSSNSAPLDAWDALHVGDTDAADLCWKDILEQISW